MSDTRAAYLAALRAIWERSAYDRGFISNPFAGDDVARLGLARTQRVLAALGRPHDPLRLLHVAGSKGKGSACAFAGAILTAHGLRTGRYTSPHLHSFRERIAIDGDAISEADFAALTARALAAARSAEADRPELGEVTAFELATAMALDHFAASKCDAAVIEVGLGGTLDATNVIHPTGCLITALDLEHTRILGATLPEIAANKAGISKPGVPVATAAYVEGAREVVAAAVARNGSAWLELGRNLVTHGTWQSFSVRGPWGELAQLRSALPGDHQVGNAALAIAGAWFLVGDRLTPDAVRAGLSSTTWPGRFEVIRRDHGTIVLDGAHTPAAAAALARAFAAIFPGRRATIVLGVLRDKDAGSIAAALAGIARDFVAITAPGPRGMPAADVAAAIASSGMPAGLAADWEQALSSRDAPVVVTGSLATVAAAREALGLAVADPILVS